MVQQLESAENLEDSDKQIQAANEEQQEIWIPEDVLELILPKLTFYLDIEKFHCVCKTWKSIRGSPSSPHAYVETSSSFPLFILIDRGRNTYNVLHPLYFNYSGEFEFFPPQLTCYRIRYSNHGWFLMDSKPRSEHSFLFNPLKKELIEIPILPPSHSYWSPSCMLFFTAPPSHPDCLVVAIEHYDSSILIHKLGEPGWKRLELNNKGGFCFAYPCRVISGSNGLFYFVDNSNLAIFDFSDLERIQENCKIIHPFHLPDHGSIVEHEGELLLVSGLTNPSIYKLDLTTGNECEALESLGKNTSLFISEIEGASFCKKVDSSGTGNKIFGPWLRDYKSGFFCFYSLTTKKFHSFFNDCSNVTRDSSREWLQGLWLRM